MIQNDDSHSAASSEHNNDTSGDGRYFCVGYILAESFYCVCLMTRDIAASERNIKYHLWPCIVGGRVTVMVRYVKHIDSIFQIRIILREN